MSKLKTWQIILIILALSIFFVLLACLAGIFLQKKNQQDRLLQTATLFGYDPALEVAQEYRCWDINAHCGQFLYFKTNLSQVEISQRVNQLAWDLRNELEVDGYEIFTALNLRSKTRLTINGQDGLGDRSNYPLLKAYQWRLADPGKRYWTITWFPLASSPASIALDGQPVQTNLLAILYQTK